MTTITTTCAACGRTLAIPERYQGRDLKCPDCGHPLRIAVPEAAPPAPPKRPDSAPVVADASPSGVGSFPTAPFAELDAPPAGDTLLPTAAVYWRVKRVGVLSAATMSAVVYAVLGLLIGLAVTGISLLSPAVAVPFVHSPLLGALAMITLPVVYGAIGFVVGLAGAAVYNLAARLAGGIKLLLE